jgi:endo-1,4-beta-xylanase
MGCLRTFVFLLLVTMTSTLTFARQTPTTQPTLRQVAGQRLLIGGAIMAADLEDPKVANLIATELSTLTGGNEFKPDFLQREKGKFTFERADRIIDFAQKHDIKVVGHTLCWHQQTPAWMFQKPDKTPLSRDEALANLKTHIETVMQHFKGKVIGWDVVNEGIADDPKQYIRDTPARRAIGDDFIIKAFELAHAADPDVELYYNDYNIDAPYKRDRALRLIRDLKAAGVRLDAVGIQGHWLLNSPPASEVDEAIAAFAKEGVKVMITEMDIDVLPRKSAGAEISATEKEGFDPYKNGIPADILKQQAKRYGELFAVFMKHREHITRITLWGIDDGRSWLNNWPVRGRTNYPMLWDRQLKSKPAYEAVLKELLSAR